MKKVLSVLAIAAFVLVNFSGCNGNGKTYADYLTQKKGWVLQAATSNPAYEMSDGSYVTDLMTEGYLYDFENAYVLTFNEDHTMYVKPGKVVAPDDFTGDAYRAETQIGTWRFDNDLIPQILYMQVPFFYDEAEETCKLLSLTENELKVSCTINDDDDPTAKGTYSFILTYVPAK